MENYNDKEEELILREPLAAYGKNTFTIEEYLEYENSSQEKHEYYNGDIFLMPPATEDHCTIQGNLLVCLAKGLKKSPYKPWLSNRRLHIPSKLFFTYSDLTVARLGDLPDDELGASLPKAIIEVLSKDTRKYDRGKKFELYKAIPSFQEYILVDSEKYAVDIYRKIDENKWELQQYTKKDRSIEIKSLKLKISFKKIYEDVRFNDLIGIPPMHLDDLPLREPIIINCQNVFTIEEYLEYEKASPVKNEYYKGHIFAMAGASENHCAIDRNLTISLGIALENSPCELWGPNLSLHIPSNTLFTYPDLRVACRDEFLNLKPNAGLPKVIIEILSPSTRKYDRGKKFELYKDIQTLQEYILVDSQKAAIDIYRKTAQNTWELQEYKIEDRFIEIKTLNLTIPFEKIYKGAQLKGYDGFPILDPHKEKIKRA